MRRILVFLLLILLIGSHPAWADMDPANKLSRGLHNTFFGWFEIFNEIGQESDRSEIWLGFPAGMIRGSAYAIGRTLAGVYETATFPLPNGKKGYGPVLLPESVFKRR